MAFITANESQRKFHRRAMETMKRHCFDEAKLDEYADILHDMINGHTFFVASNDLEGVSNWSFPDEMYPNHELHCFLKINPETELVQISICIQASNGGETLEKSWECPQVLPPDIWDMVWVKNPESLEPREVLESFMAQRCTFKISILSEHESRLAVYLPWSDVETEEDADFWVRVKNTDMSNFLEFDLDSYLQAKQSEEDRKIRQLMKDHETELVAEQGRSSFWDDARHHTSQKMDINTPIGNRCIDDE